MEGREVMNSSGVTVVGSDAPSDYHVAPRAGNPTGSAPATTTQLGFTPPGAAAAILTGKKKRGRPRKYGPDGPVAGVVTKPLSPKPISSAAPSSVINFAGEDREKLRPSMTAMKRQQQKLEMENSGTGDWVSCSVGASFTPHLINVNIGEDVTMKVISFSQQGPRAICILSANGVISSVTLRQPDSSGGTLTYEGRFEILSLTGSFMAAETGGIRNRSGGMSVSLASPDGRVIGGGVAGSLVAAGPVQIVVGSFLTGNQPPQNPKKQKTETVVTNATPTAAVPISSAEMEENHGGAYTSVTPKPNFSASSPYRGDNWTSYQPDSRTKSTDINVPLPG